MPLVFIHGVNTRFGRRYETMQIALQKLLRARVLDPLGWPTMEIITPYWGRYGVDFHWRTEDGQLSVIEPLRIFESADNVPGSSSERQLALREFADLPYAERSKIAVALEQACSDETIFENVDDVQGGEQQLGRAVMQRLGYAQAEEESQLEGLQRKRTEDSLGPSIVRRVLRVCSVVAANKLRQKLQLNLSRFMGDAFVYARDRGAPDAPGEIVRTVVEALRTKGAPGEPLIVVTYSMGGNIFYDIATHFAPDACRAKAWLAVGSQVAHFEDMKLFCASDRSIRTPQRVVSPKVVEHWFNVFDPVDPIAFAAESVFEGVKDTRYSTGHHGFTAHAAYFAQEALYHELRRCLEPVVPRA